MEIKRKILITVTSTDMELQGTVNNVRNDLNSFNMMVNNLTEKVSNLEEHQNQLSSKMDQLESKLDSIKKKKFKAVESQLEEHMTQTTSELAELHNMFNVSLTSHTEQLSHLNIKMDILNASTRENCFIKGDLDINVNGSVREELRAIDNQLKEYKVQMTSELTGLQQSHL